MRRELSSTGFPVTDPSPELVAVAARAGPNPQEVVARAGPNLREAVAPAGPNLREAGAAPAGLSLREAGAAPVGPNLREAGATPVLWGLMGIFVRKGCASASRFRRGQAHHAHRRPARLAFRRPDTGDTRDVTHEHTP